MIRTDTTDLRKLRDELATLATDMKKEMRIALKAAAKKGRSEAAKAASKVIRQPQKNLKRAAYYKINGERVEVVIRGKHRIAIKHFKPRQTKKGVTVTTGKASTFIDGRTGRKKRAGGKLGFSAGFMGPRPGVPAPKLRGQAVQRVGKERLPIAAVPAVVVVDELRAAPHIVAAMVKDMGGETRHQIERRIRYLRLKAKGGLRGRQPT